MTFGIMTVSITALSITIKKCDIEHNAECQQLIVIIHVLHAECHYAECQYAECHIHALYAECHYAECHIHDLYAKCHYAACHYAECHYAECHIHALYAERHYAECRGTLMTWVRKII
jgi:hypothetical protein